jgi:hypothetical protein
MADDVKSKIAHASNRMNGKFRYWNKEGGNRRSVWHCTSTRVANSAETVRS